MTQRILIVDDETDIRSLVAKILEGEGYLTTEAIDGKAGLTCLSTEEIDLVILDIMMPGMNGWQTCRQIKERAATAHIPVVILTVRSLLQDYSEVQTLHPDGFVNKPFDKADLLNVVNGLLSETAQA